MGKVNHIIHLVLVYYSMLNINSQCIFVYIGNKNNLMLTFILPFLFHHFHLIPFMDLESK